MKLSEAIRLGSMLGPQARGSLSQQTRRFWGLLRGPEAYCALGAAFKARGCELRAGVSQGGANLSYRGGGAVAGEPIQVIVTPPEWPMHVVTLCPVCGTDNALFRQIPHLNDLHRWTREQIAEFVETIEPVIDGDTEQVEETRSRT